jgi:type IV pilus assembly protein PilV
MYSHPARNQRGVGMIEVLVTLLLLSVGLLGMAALQARAQQAEMESYQRAQALILLEDMANRMNANRIGRNCYVGNAGQGESTYTLGCDTRADADLQDWEALLDGAAETQDGSQIGAMIGARGCVEALDVTGNLFEISVAWQGLSATQAPATNTCGEDAYGSDDLRRVVSRTVRFAVLN